MILEARNYNINLKEHINAVCDLIDSRDSVIQAMLPEANRRERLLAQAGLLEKEYPEPASRPLLFGILAGIKDIFHVDGFETRAGSKLSPEILTGKQGSAVTRLKQAGALILGKTVMTEFAYFNPGPTRNPNNTEHTPGGSSSGSAAAVASGYTSLTLGTQTIGSIIRPATYCGVYGFKPSFGRIPNDGIIPFSPSADHIGFFTQDIQGIWTAASVLCNNWKQTIHKPKQNYVIGIPAGDYLLQADKTVLTFFNQQIEKLEKSGITFIYVDPFHDIEYINKLHNEIIAAEIYLIHEDWYEKYSHLYSEPTSDLIIKGSNISLDQHSFARNEMIVVRNRIETIKEQLCIDVWMSPSSTSAAPKGLSSTGSPLMNLPWTFTGLPAISVPEGKTDNNLPLGLQFSGSFMQDEALISIINDIYLKI
ncbi:MAG: amidase [Bacteroidia bacterium]|nr:amidase [Bacteroidia bacterium]